MKVLEGSPIVNVVVMIATGPNADGRQEAIGGENSDRIKPHAG